MDDSICFGGSRPRRRITRGNHIAGAERSSIFRNDPLETPGKARLCWTKIGRWQQGRYLVANCANSQPLAGPPVAQGGLSAPSPTASVPSEPEWQSGKLLVKMEPQDFHRELWNRKRAKIRPISSCQSRSFGPCNALNRRSNGTSCRNGMDLPGRACRARPPAIQCILLIFLIFKRESEAWSPN